MSFSFLKSGAIRRGEPVSELGLTFYPIKMSQYEQFLSCKEALTLRQSTLPAKYAGLLYMDALFKLDFDAMLGNHPVSGLFHRLLTFLLMSLGIDTDTKSFVENGNLLVKVDKHGRETIAVKVKQGDITVEISSKDFTTTVLPLIAAQNGVELPDETENAEIVRAAEEEQGLKEGQSRYKVKRDIDALISSVAYLSHVCETEIWQWTVREFENRRKAIQRDKMYMLYAQAEMSGFVTLKNGNPFPSWCFDTYDKEEGATSLQSLHEQLGGGTD